MHSPVRDSPQSASFAGDSPALAGEIKDYMVRHEEVVGQLIREGGERAGSQASAQWAKVFDGLLCALFGAVRSSAGSNKVWDQLALAAVGSYGRGNFSFKSDLDVRLLCSNKPREVAPVAEALLYPLWDAGIQIGHQVVTVDDTIALAKTDLPTATSLLDWRHLVGHQDASTKLREEAVKHLFSGSRMFDFLDLLAAGAEARWERFGDSVYLLEPDVKSGQGGLRDLDITHWAAQARWGVSEIHGLVGEGVLLPVEYQQLREAAEFVARIRNVLHYFSPRRTERLSFEAQEMVAEKLGYGAGGPACEALMSDYYRHARIISNTREMVLSRAAPPPKKKLKERSLANGIKVMGESVAIEEPQQLQVNPVLALRVYWEAVHRDLPVARESRDAIARATSSETFCSTLRSSEEAARLFRRLIRRSRVVKFKRDSLLTEFHDVGLLLAMIPEFTPVVGRVHHDIYHVYTVDVHSIAAVDKLRGFCRGVHSKEHPIASSLAADIARPHVLFMATLLHDIGKDTGGRAHGERGAELCETILRRLGVAEHDVVEVQHLVRKHLRMYHVASRRDIDDPQTVSRFRDEVHGPEGLKELYLLTLCDVSTTSPNAMNSWKARMLEELYVNTLHSFQGLPTHSENRAQSIREAASALCPDPGEAQFLDHFLSVVPDRYLYANEPHHIVAHARLARQSQTRRYTTALMGTDAPYAEIGFIIEDKPGALALVTAALAANKLRVAGAQLYSWTDQGGTRRILDLFWVRHGSDVGKVKRLLPRLEEDLGNLLSGQVDPYELMHSRRGSSFSERPSPTVDTLVSFDNRSATEHTVVEVIAEDRPGLLFRLSNTLAQSGLQVGLAKINTEGNAVADVFYVVDEEGKKLEDPELLSVLDGKLREAVQKSGAQFDI